MAPRDSKPLERSTRLDADAAFVYILNSAVLLEFIRRYVGNGDVEPSRIGGPSIPA
jgi:hypothetical protein